MRAASDSTAADPVLLVDDDPEMRDAYEGGLAVDLPYARVLADGEAALDVTGRERVAVVVADQRMPGSSGADVLRVVRAVSPCTVGILATAYADAPEVRRASSDGTAMEAFQKPVSPDVLRRAVDSARERHRDAVESGVFCDACSMAAVYGCDDGWRAEVSQATADAAAALGAAVRRLRESIKRGFRAEPVVVVAKEGMG